MNISELKAFLEGMDIHEAPTPEQWKRIAEKIEGLLPEVIMSPPVWINQWYTEPYPWTLPPNTTTTYASYNTRPLSLTRGEMT